ncbi:MAG: radical SAM protein [Candidatus Micrarchaeia archaeon]
MKKTKKFHIGWGFGNCNFKCIHCYNSSKKRKYKYQLDLLLSTARQLCPIADSINFGSGEFIYNSHTIELLEFIHSEFSEVSIALTTNGSSVLRLPEEKLLYFHDIDVSLDFPTKEKQINFRQHSSAWDIPIKALQKLKSIDKIPFTIVTCVTNITQPDDIKRLLELANNFNAFLRISWLRKTGYASDGLYLNPRHAWNLLNTLVENSYIVNIDSVFGAPMGINVNKCPAGLNSLRIQDNGDVTPYTFLKSKNWVIGNIYENLDFLQNIDERVNEICSRNLFECKDCQFLHLCQGGCISRAYLHRGDKNRADDLCYKVAQIPLDFIKKIKEKIKFKKYNLVHGGYLCTTIVTT